MLDALLSENYAGSGGDEGAIASADLELFQYVEMAEEAWDAIQRFSSGADEKRQDHR